MVFAAMSSGQLTKVASTCRGALSVGLVALIVVCLSSAASAKSAQEIKINRAKAAFTLNIAKFVTWPEPFRQFRPATIALCLYDSDSLAGAFSVIEGRRVGNRVVTQATVIETLEQGQSCDVLFIPSDTLDDFVEQEAKYRPLPVLTIADATEQIQLGVSRRGVVVSLVRKQSSMGLEVNISEAENKQLKLSSELLKLAHIIAGGKP